MPNMNGFELLKNLRNNSATQLIPMILLSAKADEEASIEGDLLFMLNITCTYIY